MKTTGHFRAFGSGLLAFTALAWLGPRLLWSEGAGLAPSPTVPGGATLFVQHCSVCHGTEGRGDGAAAYLLNPRPRNFRLGLYRLVSTENGFPSKEDILQTLKNGMPGTGMPAWDHFPEEQLDKLASYVLELSRKGITESLLARAREDEENLSPEEADEISRGKCTAGQPIPVPEEPKVSVEEIARGHLLFVGNCATCHGTDGRGRKDPSWKTAEGFPAASRDLLSGIFKGGRDGPALYRRIHGGIPGTPMPGFQQLPPKDIWALAHFVQSLSNPITQELMTVRQVNLRAARVKTLPAGPEDEQSWRQVQEKRIALMPLFWRDEFRESVLVRAVHDGDRIVFLLQWHDETSDAGGLKQTEFPDACAVQHSDDREAPLFTMGDKEHRVNIWHWKGLWSEDLKHLGDISTVWPNMITDGYFGRLKGWLSKPQEDPLYLPARETGNPIAAEQRKSPIADCNATRFGSLSTQPPKEQNVTGGAVYKNGVWSVQFERKLRSQDGQDVQFTPGGKTFVAFAVWNGRIGDRDGQKSIGIWDVLEIER